MTNFNEIKGQEAAKRAVEIAMAGGHYLLLVGPSGMGKTMLINAASEINREIAERYLHEARPCLCGLYGDTLKECTCDSVAIQYHQSKFPDCEMMISVPRVPFDKLILKVEGESTEIIAGRIEVARNIQKTRGITNESLKYPEDGKMLFKRAIDSLGLSARDYYNALMVARTIADLDESPDIRVCHIAESIQYRLKFN